MIRYRARAVLLLFLLLNLTACSTWQSVATPNPAQFIEEDRPERVRVTTLLSQLELVDPSVKGDELMGHVNEPSLWCRVFLGGYTRRGEDECDRFVVRSIPLADIFTLEIRKGDTRSGVLMGLGLVAAFVLTTMGVLNIKSHTN